MVLLTKGIYEMHSKLLEIKIYLIFQRSKKAVNLYKSKIQNLQKDIEFLNEEIIKVNEIINNDKKNLNQANQ